MPAIKSFCFSISTTITTKVVQFGFPKEHGYAVTPAVILAVREDGLMLVEANGLVGNASPLWEGNHSGYAETAEATCTHGCERIDAERFYGSMERLYADLGFEGFKAV